MGGAEGPDRAARQGRRLHPGRNTRRAHGHQDPGTLAPADTVEKLQVEEKECTYLFGDGESITFMDQESFEQPTVTRELLGEPGAFLQDGMLCTVVMAVTEADPVVKGQTAASSYKPGLLENGVHVLIPPFVEAGTRIVVNTADATYVERAKG
ncbi:elongation factor P, C-terminal-domain-containing protein [Lactifluus subvellereus]|nr:elongation factor P, C-terminal-domain-containing protein [Lactifluus subvellereus]